MKTLQAIRETLASAKADILADYWRLVNECSQDLEIDPEEVVRFLDAHDFDFVQFQIDVEKAAKRRQMQAKLATEAKLRSDLDKLEAEHKSEIEHFQKIEAEHVKKCQSLYDQKEVIRTGLADLEQIRREIRDLHPQAAEARKEDAAIGRRMVELQATVRRLHEARQTAEHENNEPTLANVRRMIHEAEHELARLQHRRGALEASLLQ